MKKEELHPIFSCKGNGKLLLSGEYLVLKGAKALSVPLKLGQTLHVYNQQNDGVLWEAYHPKGLWNKVIFNDKLAVVDSTNAPFAKQTQKILRSSIKLSDYKLTGLMGKKIVTHLDFSPDWGFGSSSTLIYTLSQYFEINPYTLLQQTFKGSGYDIANAKSSFPLFFLLINNEPRSMEINFNPPFSKQIYFIYSGKKQSSKASIKGFSKKEIAVSNITKISAISTLMAVSYDLKEFRELMDEHEKIIGEILQEIPLKAKLFSDFNGSIKSLGAWGGDFFMAVTDEPYEYVKGYFSAKKLNTLFTYDELVLTPPCQDHD
jgi:mevalonate kinase